MSRTGAFSFGAVAEKMGLVKRELVDVCLLIQSADKRAGHAICPLGEIMVDKGFLTEPQVELILKEQRRLAGARHLGPYYLVSKLGEGGMGSVFKARVRATGAMVALKILPRRFSEDPSYLKRFKREAAVGLELNHPNIVRILTVGEDRDSHYMSMELVEGGDLKKILKKHKRLKQRMAMSIIRNVASALEHARQMGIVHRDVKPSNIMFTKEGLVKLTDFGLVKAPKMETAVLTRTGCAVGTPHYISPEQAQGKRDVDIRADIFSLGATFYHLVTGVRPFEGESAVEIMTRVVEGVFIPPEELNPKLHADCATIIKKMMARQRDLRYKTPAEVAFALNRILGKTTG